MFVDTLLIFGSRGETLGLNSGVGYKLRDTFLSLGERMESENEASVTDVNAFAQKLSSTSAHNMSKKRHFHNSTPCTHNTLYWGKHLALLQSVAYEHSSLA